MNIWIELVAVTVELFLIIYFYTGVLGRANSSKLRRLVIGLGYSAVLAALSLFTPSSPLRSALIICFTYVASVLYFNIKWENAVYPTIIFFLFSILADIFCGTVLQLSGVPSEDLMGDSTARLIYIIFGKIFHLLCLYLILTITKAKFDTRVFLRSLPLLSCQILSIYICQKNFALVIAGNAPSILRLETLGLLYINLVICAFVEMLNRSHEREREAENARRQLELQENYYADLMARQEETRSLWHDMKKYMASVEALIANENREEAQRCLEGIYSAFSELSSAVDTGNKLVDSILTYGIKRAREHGVSVRPDIWVDNNLAFPATDLFVIIGNTLDNAIEACAQLDDAAERVITVTLRQNNHLLLYEISNPYVDKNTRKPGKIHGYGLKNVRACVERNEGLLHISRQDNIFRVSIQLNIGEK